MLRLPAVREKDGAAVSLHDVFGRFYGDCWTLDKRDRDAFWRIYAPNKDGVRVTTTVAKLTAAFAKCLAANVGSVYFGRVQYVDGDEWADYLSDGDNASSIIFGSAVGRAHTLFLKRKTFKHEQEFRIVYHDASRTQGDGRLYQLAIPASEVIDQILVDGRLPQNELEAVTLEVNAHLNDVPERSTIYDVPYGRLLVIDGYGSRVSSDSVDTST